MKSLSVTRLASPLGELLLVADEASQQVWSALRTIPPGTVVTYGALAARLDRPKAARAVGSANGLNPIPIVVPCHRLIGADARLTGYAGGLERKRWLLQHEGFVPGGVSRQLPSDHPLL